MIVLQDLRYEIGSRVLFENLNWHLRPGEKCGLIGANGTGKSTLLRVISGEYQSSGGKISSRNELSLGFLNQDLLSHKSDKSILEVALEAFVRVNQLEAELELLQEKLVYDHSDAVLNRFHEVQSEYDLLDGYSARSKAERLLEGLGFKTSDLNRPLNEFSGGWRMRVMLAKILLQEPNVLLLDEPTNHLDLPPIQWLEDYLSGFEGALIIVSHDRFFLDRTITQIAELENRKLTFYTGNYADYLEQKAERMIIQQNQFKNQEKYIKEQERFIERFKAKASKASAAQSRIKALERLDRVEAVQSGPSVIKIRFDVARQPGKVLAHLQLKSKKYSEQTVLENSEISINRGDKIALIGANGKGKSTVLRIVNGSEPFEGKLEEGHNVICSFYAQHQLESLNTEQNPLDELRDFAPEETESYLRSLLGAFLLQGDDVFKKIKVLSGGERARVALAKTILAKANFLLMDEPTNHLDIPSVNTLVDVLTQYEGSYIIVSHDRYFLSRIANKIWYIDNKILKEYPGTYAEYDTWMQDQEKKSVASVKNEEPKKKVEPKVTKPKTEQGPEQKKEVNRLRQNCEKLESLIRERKAELQQIESDLSDPELFKRKEEFQSLNKKYEQRQLQLKESETEWEAYYLRLIELTEK